MSRAIHKMRGRIAPIVIVGTVLGNVSSVDGTTHSLGSIDVGAASNDKNVTLGITWEDTSFIERTISSLTVGGVSLSQKITETAASSNVSSAAIWAGDIASINGSQAISVTFSLNVESVGVSGVAISGLQSLTPTMSDGDFTTSSAQLTITSMASQTDGIAFAVGIGASQSGDPTWGSLTERSDVQTGGAAEDHRHTAAWDLGLHSAADETFDAGGAERAVCGAGFR